MARIISGSTSGSNYRTESTAEEEDYARMIKKTFGKEEPKSRPLIRTRRVVTEAQRQRFLEFFQVS